MKENKSTKAKSNVKNGQDNVYLKTAIAIVVFCISLLLLSKSTNITETVLVEYDTNSDISYRVNLFPNNYIKLDYMEEGKTYVADLVSTIDVDFNYSIESSKDFDSEYVYDIYALATVNHNSTGKELWTEELKLVENVSVSPENSNTISISNSVSLPYNQLNTKVKAFKAEYNIPITSYVDLKLIVKDKNTNQKITSTGLSMDLFEDVFEVKEDHTGKSVTNITESKEPNKIVVAIEGIIVIISALYVVFIIYNTINSTINKKSYYSRTIYRILKNYGDIVAELVKPVDLTGLKVIDVKNFDQMLDVEEELRIPIMFFETVKNEEGHFVLVHRDMAYRYILKDKFKN